MPDEISQILGLTPTSSTKLDEQGELGNRPYTVASWEFKTKETTLTEDVSEPLDDLITVFQEKIDNLKTIKKLYDDCTIVVYIVVYNNQEILPGFSLTPEQIAFLANVGIGIDCDFYQQWK